jgi:hypothetical protein
LTDCEFAHDFPRLVDLAEATGRTPLTAFSGLDCLFVNMPVREERRGRQGAMAARALPNGIEG